MAKGKKKTEITKSTQELMNSEEFKEAVRGALGDIDTYAGQLQAVSGIGGEEAKKKIAQSFFQNMKWAQEPEQAAKYLLAKQMTYMSLMEQVDPMAAIRDIETQIKLMDSVRKNVKLVNDMKPKEINMNIQGKDDGMKLDFIDIEE